MATIRNPIEWSGAQLASAAHAAEAVGRSVDHMRQTAHSPAPSVRRISTAEVWQSLRRGGAGVRACHLAFVPETHSLKAVSRAGTCYRPPPWTSACSISSCRKRRSR